MSSITEYGDFVVPMLLNGIVATAKRHVVTIIAQQDAVSFVQHDDLSWFACVPVAVTLVSKPVNVL